MGHLNRPLFCCPVNEHTGIFRTHIWYARRTATSCVVFRHIVDNESWSTSYQEVPQLTGNFCCPGGGIVTPSQQGGYRAAHGSLAVRRQHPVRSSKMSAAALPQERMLCVCALSGSSQSRAFRTARVRPVELARENGGADQQQRSCSRKLMDEIHEWPVALGRLRVERSARHEHDALSLGRANGCRRRARARLPSREEPRQVVSQTAES